MSTQRLKKLAKSLPQKPGIYFFLGKDKEVLYIGKARSLRNRVHSYFLPTTDSKVHKILAETREIDTILTESEREASFLESNFIREYQPRFNERLKDDKSFPYLKLTQNESYPGIYLTRKVEADGARYFGPFSPAHQARKTILLLNRYFGIRDCREAIPGRRRRPCLQFDLKLCSAPCVGFITESEYKESVDNALLFLEGKVEELLRILQPKMKEASSSQRFEEAAQWRDLIFSLEQIKEKPRFITTQSEDKDIFGWKHAHRETALFIFLMRRGKVVQSHTRLVPRTDSRKSKKNLARAVRDYYQDIPDLPDKIVLPQRPEGLAELQRELNSLKGKKVEIHVPQRGKDKKLVELACRNASLLLKKKTKEPFPSEALQEALGLPCVPRRIEGYDISNTGGAESVGSGVTFLQGKPYKDRYRRYRIKTIAGPNDVASLQEVLGRRFSKEMEAGDLPDLVLVDGGKGQWNAARKTLNEMGFPDLPLISIAKKEEVIYSEMHPRGLRLPRNSPALQLAQRIRDEAHRFAITFHRQRRAKKSFATGLEGIPGIGPKRRQLLLSRYGTLQTIREAPADDLASLIGRKAAHDLLAALKDR
jgi:excinuclease ABC subunit C